MPLAMTPELEEKIQRRAKRAWRLHRRGKCRRISRISDVTDRTLKYRLPDIDNWYGSSKVIVRRKKGEVVIETPPRGSMITMNSKYDLSKLDSHNGRVRAFKYTTQEGKSPTRTGDEALTYRVGDIVSVKNADKSKSADCSYGINLASKDWIKDNINGDQRVFACEFEIEDLAAVPHRSGGKFRVFKCEVIEELDPSSIGPLKVPTKCVKPMTVDGDPLTHPLKDRLSARKRKLIERKQKALEKKMLPAVTPNDGEPDYTVELTPPARQLPEPPKAEKEGRPGWLERVWKKLGF